MIISNCQCPQPTQLISSFCLGRDLYCVVGCIGHLRWSAGISGGSVGISPPRHLIFGINEDWHCPLLARTKTGWMGLGGEVKEQQPVQSHLGVTLKTVCGGGEHLCQTIRGSSKERPLLSAAAVAVLVTPSRPSPIVCWKSSISQIRQQPPTLNLPPLGSLFNPFQFCPLQS